MSVEWQPLSGTDIGGVYQADDYFGYQSAEKIRNNQRLEALGVWQHNVYGGGSEEIGIGNASPADTGWNTVPNSLRFEIPNQNNQISDSDDLVCQVSFVCRVADVGETLTFRVYNETGASVPTQSGALSCSATNSDFSGTHQQQTIAFTPAVGVKSYVLQYQKAVDLDQAWIARIKWALYLDY